MTRAGPLRSNEREREGSDRTRSRFIRALLAMREMILDGELAPGERISELYVAKKTGISRTPIRAALQTLEEESLVEMIPSGGYAVRSISEQDVFDAIEIRGCLEGLAARLAAERGVPPARLADLTECLEELDEVVATKLTTENGFELYLKGNARFHTLLVSVANSPLLARQIEKASALPFASPSGFVMAQAVMPEEHRMLAIAQDQHRCVLDAIRNRQSARAEAIMQEHARVAERSLRIALKSEKMFARVPGGSLIRTVV